MDASFLPPNNKSFYYSANTICYLFFLRKWLFLRLPTQDPVLPKTAAVFISSQTKPLNFSQITTVFFFTLNVDLFLIRLGQQLLFIFHLRTGCFLISHQTMTVFSFHQTNVFLYFRSCFIFLPTQRLFFYLTSENSCNLFQPKTRNLFRFSHDKCYFCFSTDNCWLLFVIRKWLINNNEKNIYSYTQSFWCFIDDKQNCKGSCLMFYISHKADFWYNWFICWTIHSYKTYYTVTQIYIR